uniref:Uncharacterized protein n=1 Tax=Glossina palpalis gambiensis TaxID=67801 RepID=A0A1B0BQ15_9MUSC
MSNNYGNYNDRVDKNTNAHDDDDDDDDDHDDDDHDDDDRVDYDDDENEVDSDVIVVAAVVIAFDEHSNSKTIQVRAQVRTKKARQSKAVSNKKENCICPLLIVSQSLTADCIIGRRMLIMV